jgi:hypothetical protein
MIKKLSTFIATLGIALLIGAPAYAQTSDSNVNNVLGNSNTGTTQQSTSGSTSAGATSQNKCGTTKTQLLSCGNAQTGVGTINSLISTAITVLSVMIGTVAVGGLAYGAILYASARDDQSQVTNARTIIRNIIIGLVLYVFSIALVNWLVPGGVISGGGGTTASPSVSPSSSSTSTATGTQ